LLSTSGVDGVSPAGLGGARVLAVDRHGESGFARIQLAPASQPDSVRHVLVLEPLALQLPKRPEPEPAADTVKGGRRSSRPATSSPAPVAAGASR
jgi:rod shape-determining protein MreC